MQHVASDNHELPMVVIGIPTDKGCELLPRCIDSALAQTDGLHAGAGWIGQLVRVARGGVGLREREV
jgi:hypothetical protein